MKTLKACSAFVIGLCFLANLNSVLGQQQTGIQEAQVLAILKSMDAALLKKDAKSACTNFAEDAVITIVLFERGEKFSDTYNKKQYQAMLETGFENFSDYTSERSGTQVRIAADGKSATVKSTFAETFRRDGSKMKCVAEESYAFELGSGRLRIKTMSNLAKMQ